MKKTLIFEYDEGKLGYYRVIPGVTINKDYIQGSAGIVIAHDFIEHPRGYPTGTLEDEIAAFGAIISIRLHALLSYRHTDPIVNLSEEIVDMLEQYRHQVPTHKILKPRKRCHKYITCDMETIAASITDCPVLQRRLQAWFGYGAYKLQKRFGDNDTWTYSLFQEIVRAVEHIDLPFFKLRVDSDRCRAEVIDDGW